MPEINIFKKYTPAELHSLIAKNLDDPAQMMTAAALLCGFVHDLTSRVTALEEEQARLKAEVSELNSWAEETHVTSKYSQ